MVCTCGQDFCYGCRRSGDSCLCGSRVRAHCGYCSRKGHLKSNCPRITCFACSQKGHTTRHCPYTPVCATCTKHHLPSKSCPLPKTCEQPLPQSTPVEHVEHVVLTTELRLREEPLTTLPLVGLQQDELQPPVLSSLSKDVTPPLNESEQPDLALTQVSILNPQQQDVQLSDQPQLPAGDIVNATVVPTSLREPLTSTLYNFMATLTQMVSRSVSRDYVQSHDV